MKSLSSWKFLLFGLWTFSLVHCAPDGMKSNVDPEGLTGYVASSGAPYTVGGDDRVNRIEEGEMPVPPATAPPSSADSKLAQSITAVSISRLNVEGKIDRFGTNQVQVTFQLKDSGAVSFTGALTKVGTQLHRVQNLKSASFTLDVELENEPNQKFTKGKFLFKQLDNLGRAKAKAELFSRGYAARVDVIPSADQTLMPVNQRVVQFLKDRAFAWVSNQVVRNGPSFYEVQFLAATKEGHKSTDPIDLMAAGKRIFTFSGADVRTGDYPDEPALVQPGLLEPISASLFGNAEVKDVRTYDVTLKGFQLQNIQMALKVHREGEIEEENQPPQDRKMHGLSPSSYFPAVYTNSTSPRIRRMIDDFEQNYDLAIAQNWIRKYAKPGSFNSDLLSALQTAQPFKALISAIFHYYEVASPASLVTIIESAFFTGGQFALQTNPISTASGPFQLTYDTARDQGMRVFSHPKGRLPPRNDERLFFVPAACGAAKKLYRSGDLFLEHDGTLTLLAYYLGDGGMAQLMSAAAPKGKSKDRDIERIRRYRLKFREMVRQKIGRGDAREYVAKALALYFVTGNPIDHGIIWKEEPLSKLPSGKILPPTEIKDPSCRQAIAPLIKKGLISR